MAARTLEVLPSLSLNLSEFEFSYTRSSGPGGQNVNKVSSKVLLRWPLAASRGLSEQQRARLLLRLAHRLTADGDLLVTSQKHRDQARNTANCLDKLRAMLITALAVPKRRRATRPTLASRQRRLEGKKRQAVKKLGRSAGGQPD